MAAHPAQAGAPRRAVAAALFDWDGTLIDSHTALLAAWHESTRHVLGRTYPATPAEHDLVLARPGSQIWPALARDPAELDALVAGFQAAYEQAAEEVRAFSGVPEMLEELRADGVAIAVVTSKARCRFEPETARTGLTSLIDVAICAEDADGAKPDPDPVLRALERLGVAGAYATMIGDTPVDVAAGLGAGTRAVGVAWGRGGGSELIAAGAEAVAHDPAELCALLLAERRSHTPASQRRGTGRSAA